MSVSFSGELAYELHVPNASLMLVHELIMAAGEAHGIGYFGMRAVESMRLEKGYMHWKADLITEFNPAHKNAIRRPAPQTRLPRTRQ